MNKTWCIQSGLFQQGQLGLCEKTCQSRCNTCQIAVENVLVFIPSFHFGEMTMFGFRERGTGEERGMNLNHENRHVIQVRYAPKCNSLKPNIYCSVFKRGTSTLLRRSLIFEWESVTGRYFSVVISVTAL